MCDLSPLFMLSVFKSSYNIMSEIQESRAKQFNILWPKPLNSTSCTTASHIVFNSQREASQIKHWEKNRTYRTRQVVILLLPSQNFKKSSLWIFTTVDFFSRNSYTLHVGSAKAMLLLLWSTWSYTSHVVIGLHVALKTW